MPAFTLIHRLLLLTAFFLAGCLAPKASTKKPAILSGYSDTIKNGKVTDGVEFITRLANQELLHESQIRRWVDSDLRPDLLRRMRNVLLKEGNVANAKMLSLGAIEAGAHLAVSVLKPDIKTAEVLAGWPATKVRFWNTRKGVLLVHLSPTSSRTSLAGSWEGTTNPTPNSSTLQTWLT
ncbi:conserved hypothetical Ustilaginaceae_specific protein [Sporisorium reilianum SRZ2]|uniref:Conserved hypothetical Ustilaginaceae_specific protein n=1 Tax=Sporisorium reilianum (strain SRZ2) TaxID=999809 RepID=E6ZS85_SPORE|nr:conserved hypothetical Ustilaginaceae_specific protein [Sporisorium reilianum SRZ2]